MGGPELPKPENKELKDNPEERIRDIIKKLKNLKEELVEDAELLAQLSTLLSSLKENMKPDTTEAVMNFIDLFLNALRKRVSEILTFTQKEGLGNKQREIYERTIAE